MRSGRHRDAGVLGSISPRRVRYTDIVIVFADATRHIASR